jgi:hypothetical protein
MGDIDRPINRRPCDRTKAEAEPCLESDDLTRYPSAFSEA